MFYFFFIGVSNFKQNSGSSENNFKTFIHFNLTLLLNNTNIQDFDLFMNLDTSKIIDSKCNNFNAKLIMRIFYCEPIIVRYRNPNHQRHYPRCTFRHLTDVNQTITAETQENLNVNLFKLVDLLKSSNRQNTTTTIMIETEFIESNCYALTKDKSKLKSFFIEQPILYAYSNDSDVSVKFQHVLHKRDITDQKHNHSRTQSCSMKTVELNTAIIFNKIRSYPEKFIFSYCDNFCRYSLPIDDLVNLSLNEYVRVAHLGHKKISCIATSYEPFYYFEIDQYNNILVHVEDKLNAMKCGCR